MAKYLISFPSGAMQVAPEEFQTVIEESHAVVAAAKIAKSCRCAQELRAFAFDPES